MADFQCIAFRITVATVIVAGVSSACSDPDPRYGPPGAIRGRTVDFGGGNPTSPEVNAGEGGAVAKTSQQLFTELYATITGAAAGTPCTPCHQPAGTGVSLFVGTGATDAYAIFKRLVYQDITKANTFYTKGVHTGPALNAAQQALTKKWSEAEAQSATGGPGTDAGGG